MSNETQWTPGPWKVEPIQHVIDRIRARGEATFYTASILPKAEPFRGFACHMQSCEHIDGITGPECEANARLIAAAPEMAALLERNQNVIMDALTSGHGITPAIADDMRAVLAEARALLAKIKGATHA